MSDYWKDSRPPAERLPDCERLLERSEAKIEWMRSEVEQLHNAQIRILKTSTEAIRRAEEDACQSRQERDELIEMLKELLRENYIPNSRRTAAYDLVVRLGGYRGNADE